MTITIKMAAAESMIIRRINCKGRRSSFSRRIPCSPSCRSRCPQVAKPTRPIPSSSNCRLRLTTVRSRRTCTAVALELRAASAHGTSVERSSSRNGRFNLVIRIKSTKSSCNKNKNDGAQTRTRTGTKTTHITNTQRDALNENFCRSFTQSIINPNDELLWEL